MLKIQPELAYKINLMRIAYTISGLYNSGGMENILTQKVNYLAEVLGYDVTVITTDQEDKPTFYEISPKVKRVDLGINYSRAKSSGLWHLKKIALKRLHKKRLSEFLLKENFDICITLMDFDLGFLHSIKDGSKKIAEFHFSRYAKMLATTNPVKKKLQYFRTFSWKRILSKYYKFIVLTHQDKDQWGRMPNIEVIPNFINFEPEELADMKNKRIISVGRSDYQKGFDMLLSAWSIAQSKLPDWELVIFGGGDKSGLLTQIKNQNIRNIRLCAPTPAIGQEYLKSSLYVMSSRYEGLPLVLLEAMSYGLPVVSFNCPCGPSDIILPEFGKLVPANDINALAKAIVEFGRDEEKRSKASLEARKRSIHFSKKEIMERWNKLFEDVLKG